MHNRAALLLNSLVDSVVDLAGHRCLNFILALLSRDL
jgi:hypothetical protein